MNEEIIYLEGNEIVLRVGRVDDEDLFLLVEKGPWEARKVAATNFLPGRYLKVGDTITIKRDGSDFEPVEKNWL